MPFEHHKKPLLPRKQFVHRQLRYAVFSLFILILSCGLGTLGYHALGNLSWVDAFLNASMILAGMGPVDHLETNSAKLFASFYALFSGIAFIAFAGVLFAPVYHRFMHKLHLNIEGKIKAAQAEAAISAIDLVQQVSRPRFATAR